MNQLALDLQRAHRLGLLLFGIRRCFVVWGWRKRIFQLLIYSSATAYLLAVKTIHGAQRGLSERLRLSFAVQTREWISCEYCGLILRRCH